jgi:hypothetical protein
MKNRLLTIIARLVKLGIYKETLYFLVDVLTEIATKIVYILAIVLGAWITLLGAVVGIFFLLFRTIGK